MIKDSQWSNSGTLQHSWSKKTLDPISEV